MLILLLPIHANSTPFPFQEMTSSHSVHSRELAHSLGRLSIKAPHSRQPSSGLVIQAGPTGFSLLGTEAGVASQVWRRVGVDTCQHGP